MRSSWRAAHSSAPRLEERAPLWDESRQKRRPTNTHGAGRHSGINGGRHGQALPVSPEDRPTRRPTWTGPPNQPRGQANVAADVDRPSQSAQRVFLRVSEIFE